MYFIFKDLSECDGFGAMLSKTKQDAIKTMSKAIFPDLIDIDYNPVASFDFYQKCFFGSESSNNVKFLPEGTWKLVRIKEIIEL